MSFYAIAPSHFNKGQTLVLTTHKRNRWRPAGCRQAKGFDTFESARKEAARNALLLTPEILSASQYQKLCRTEKQQDQIIRA